MRRSGYYTLIGAIDSEMRKQGFASVTYGTEDEIDMNNQSLFPTCHIVLPTGVTQAKMSTLTPSLVVADLIDEQKEYQDTMNEVFDPTNTLDIHQDLLAKAQAALKMVDTHIEIDLLYPYSWDSFKFNYTNRLAGWLLVVGFEVQNMDDGIC